MRILIQCRPLWIQRRRTTTTTKCLSTAVAIIVAFSVIALSDVWSHEGNTWMVVFLVGVEAFTTTSKAVCRRIRYSPMRGQQQRRRVYHYSPRRWSSALLVSERTSVKSIQARDTTASSSLSSSSSSSSVLPPAYVIDRISKIPTNDKLFERISNMCIDVFFKEQLMESTTSSINGSSNTKKGKLL
jgi:hypothetical protein